MIVVTIYVPVADNDGRAFRPADYARFESYVSDHFGGVTRLPGKLAGRWTKDGTLYFDRSWAYQIGIESLTHGAKIAALASFAKEHFRQEAIYFGYLGLAEIL